MGSGQGAQSGRWIRAAAAALLAALMLALAPSGAAAVVADAGCPGPADTPPPINRTGDQREAQVFTPSRTGTLTRATVEITNPGPSLLDPSSDFAVQLLLTDNAGAPAADVLSSTTVPNASVPMGTATLNVAFSPAPEVVAGHPYALMIARPGTFTAFQPHTRGGDQCPGAAFWASGPNVGWAAEAAGTDVVFQTYIKPANKFGVVGKKGRLFARVPGPGTVIVKRNRLVRKFHTTARDAGDVQLKLKLTGRAIRRVLLTRKLDLPLRITYTPTGGDPNTERFKIKIRL
jgi:hypothetical protein